jgi:energy-coupling factor transport system substrate-specific component
MTEQASPRTIDWWSIGAQFTTRAWVLIPVGVGLNFVGDFIVKTLRLPLFLDVIGTIVISVLAGPWVGAVTGTISAVINNLSNPPIWLYSLAQIAIAFTAGFMASRGWFKSIWKAAVVGVAITIVSIIISSPITAIVFGGLTGDPTDLLTGFFLATTDNVVNAVIGSQAITQPIDKIISTILAFLVGVSIPLRYRPPFGRQVLPE